MLMGHHAGAELVVVAGGTSRQDSVRSALAALPDDVEAVLVHDAARPLTPVELIDAVAAAVHAGADAVVPGLRVVDTVKRVRTDATGTDTAPTVAETVAETVVETVERASLRAVQTPQGFRRSVLTAAHEAASLAALDVACADLEATDDAGLVERIGGTVRVIPGEEDAFKVTRPIDFDLAEAVLARRRTDGVP